MNPTVLIGLVGLYLLINQPAAAAPRTSTVTPAPPKTDTTARDVAASVLLLIQGVYDAVKEK